ncbi:MAG: TIM barrel protein [Nanoarchaeota archaeon]|nr:TIM barrel protein [Nanoarchaeota archaeon]MBU1705001.1 TIM barrel protein [Nanoarchaeota archaeon]
MIRIGPAGSFGLGNLEGIGHAKELGLSAFEVEFTYGVRMSNAEAKKIGALAKELGIILSVHAPYYINLNSVDKEKIVASKKRILDSCERGANLGATHIVFHAGFYGKIDKETTYQNIKKEVFELLKTIKDKGWSVKLAPETTGKGSQFGDIDELLRLTRETGCSICVDFAHIKARNNGKIDYDEVFTKLKAVKHIHAHFSGIEFTAKGERKHKLTENSEIKELIDYVKRYKANVTIINESPDPYGDCVKTLKLI